MYDRIHKHQAVPTSNSYTTRSIIIIHLYHVLYLPRNLTWEATNSDCAIVVLGVDFLTIFLITPSEIVPVMNVDNTTGVFQLHCPQTSQGKVSHDNPNRMPWNRI